MVEAELVLLIYWQSTPITAGRFEQAVSADNIGLDKVRRPVDRTIHMGLGRQVHHRRGLELGKHRIQRSPVTDIHMIEVIARRIGH
ncbi:hypothetical protein D9M71_783930 [compost metagenome]